MYGVAPYCCGAVDIAAYCAAAAAIDSVARDADCATADYAAYVADSACAFDDAD